MRTVLDQFTTKIKSREVTFTLTQHNVDDFRISRKVGESSSVMAVFETIEEAEKNFKMTRETLNGAVIGIITLKAVQMQDENGKLDQAVAAIFEPKIKIHKTGTHDLLTDLSKQISVQISDILDFDNS